MLVLMLTAWLIGIATAAPVGPIGILCVRKTLEFGLRGALSVGVGAALADSLYGLLASLGFAAVEKFIVQHAPFIKLVGGCGLLYVAWREFFLKPVQQGNKELEDSSRLLWLMVEVFFLTLANPLTIFGLMGFFAILGHKNASFSESLLFALGIFLGSMTWWLMLGGFTKRVKSMLRHAWTDRIRYVSAILIGGIGLWAVLTSFLFVEKPLVSRFWSSLFA